MAKQQHILVWDIFVRIFHWSLVMLVLLAFTSGDDAGWLHVYCGYSILVLIALRLIWGFIGARYARFTSFVTAPRVALDYLKSMLTGKPKYYPGHNPAAGWMILALLVTLLVVNGSGYLALSAKGSGVASQDLSLSLIAEAHADDDEDEDEKHGDGEAGGIWKDVHEAVAGFLLVLVAAHILGALASSLVHRENLIKAMLTGKKVRREQVE